jgi:O-antigen ligase
MTRNVAAAGAFVLAALAPFEATAPIVRVPGQSISSLEAIVIAALAAWALSLAVEHRLPAVPPLAWPWVAFVAVMATAAFAAGPLRGNALRMTGRFVAAAAVYCLAVDTLSTRARLRTAIRLSVASAVVVAVLAVLERFDVGSTVRILSTFRQSATAVGAQLRAGGPLQYPTIASMYLEIAFAFAMGLMLCAIDERSRPRAAIWLLAALVIAEGITLTFTRAGLITVALTLLLIGASRWRTRGADAGVTSVAAAAVLVVAIVVSSRSADSLWLRMTSEAQGGWYRAEIDAPREVTFEADRAQYVTVLARNTGRLKWDSDDSPPIVFSYHWLLPDADRVVAFNGERTAFERPVLPGGSATVHALVRAPQRPGRYRLEWDLAQEGRLWFSTEPDAPPSAMSHAVVSGAPREGSIATTARPRRAVRPGRVVLWSAALRMVQAHPVLGVGPDNFRLLYGSFAGLVGADSRTHSNNMYLEVLAGGGLLAALVFAWFLRDAALLFARAARPGSDLGPTRVRPGSDLGPTWVRPGSDPGPTPIGLTPLGLGLAAGGLAIAVHGFVDSFLSFAPTYILFSLTLGYAAALARGAETPPDAYRL